MVDAAYLAVKPNKISNKESSGILLQYFQWGLELHMRRSTTLSTSHYAGKWEIPDKDQRNDLRAVNLLGYEYATAPDGKEKEQKLLLVLECFHGYLMKYLCMIVRGTIPPLNTYAGKDSAELLRFIMPKNSDQNKSSLEDTCKTLHLAFKQQTTEEIYDTLAFCFMRAARKYDPYYADKTRRVCELIDEIQKKDFPREELEQRAGFDCLGILRGLVKQPVNGGRSDRIASLFWKNT